MISDASSAIIEFAALNKPVLWCTFLQLRWNYKGIFSYRFKARMDKDYDDYGQIAKTANSYDEMVSKAKNLLMSEDVIAALNAIKKLGIKISLKNNFCKILILLQSINKN